MKYCVVTPWFQQKFHPRLPNEDNLNIIEHHDYREIVGGISYIYSCTRLDINLL